MLPLAYDVFYLIFMVFKRSSYICSRFNFSTNPLFMKNTHTYLVGAFAVVSSFFIVSCGFHPGGLSDEEWNSLPPSRRAELTMQQEALTERQIHDSQQSSHWQNQDNNYENKWDKEARKDMNNALRKNNSYKPDPNESVGQQLRDAGL